MRGSSVFIYGKIPDEELRSKTPERLRECNVNRLTDMCTFAPLTPQAAGFSERSSSTRDRRSMMVGRGRRCKECLRQQGEAVRARLVFRSGIDLLPKTPVYWCMKTLGPDISDKRRLYEILAIAALAFGRLLFMVELGWRLPFIIVVVLGWSSYVYYRLQAKPELRNYWGLLTDGFWSSFLKLLPIALLCIASFLAYGFHFETEVLDWTLIIIILVYPIWGIVQQFLALGIFARNLSDGWGGNRPEWEVILLTGGLFGLIHYPFPLLMLATFFLGLVYAWLYLRGYNLLALGVYHGVLGGVFFYTVLGRNSFLEAFG